MSNQNKIQFTGRLRDPIPAHESAMSLVSQDGPVVHDFFIDMALRLKVGKVIKLTIEEVDEDVGTDQ